MQKVEILIVGDIDSGNVAVKGPINDMRIVHWLCNEAIRHCSRLATKRDEAAESPIILAKGLPQ